MALVYVPADDPHLVLVDGIAGSVPAFPVLSGVERRIEEGVCFVEPPILAIGRTPHFIVANPRKVLLIAGIPAADKPHAAVERQRPRSVARGKCGLGRYLFPFVLGGFLSRKHRPRARSSQAEHGEYDGKGRTTVYHRFYP